MLCRSLRNNGHFIVFNETTILPLVEELNVSACTDFMTLLVHAYNTPLALVVMVFCLVFCM